MKIKTYNINDKIPLGKYEGEYVKNLINRNPFYLQWLHNNTIFKLDEDTFFLLRKEIMERHIKKYKKKNTYQNYFSDYPELKDEGFF